MEPIEGILFDPVGCLAEFPAEPFLDIAARFFTGKKQTTQSASRAYWHLLNLMEASGGWNQPAIVELETQAASAASIFEDVVPALAELKELGIKLAMASSLSAAALEYFLVSTKTRAFFSTICSRDSAGIKAAPIAQALRELELAPANALYLTDTAEGLKVAKSLGLNAILMMNDPDDAKRLAVKGPAGGIVSLHEFPDFIRLLRAQNRT